MTANWEWEVHSLLHFMNHTKNLILVIEDNQDVRENLIELLTLSGFEVEGAPNGKVGVKTALKILPDLILCDIMMPEIDGYGVLQILSKHPQTLKIPFIFLSAKTEHESIRKGMNLGADDYITKPFEEAGLITAIENRLKKHQAIISGDTVKSNKESDWFKKIFNSRSKRTVHPNEVIYCEGDSPTHVYYLSKGKVKLTKANDIGKESIVDLCTEGDFFGYWSVLQDCEQMETAEAIDISEVWCVPRENFSELLQSDIQLNHDFIKILSKNLLIKENKIIELSYDTVRKRVANALVSICDIYGINNYVKMKMPRDLIASMAGTSVETAIRMISEFKSDKMIAIKGSEIEILEYDKLKNAKY